MHEYPKVAHSANKATGPMINQSSRHIKHLVDDYNLVTKDSKLSAQWQHTVLVTDNGFEILILREEEKTGFATWYER